MCMAKALGNIRVQVIYTPCLNGVACSMQSAMVEYIIYILCKLSLPCSSLVLCIELVVISRLASVMRLSDLVMGQQQLNHKLFLMAPHVTSQHKTAAHQRGLRQQACPTRLPCPGPVNMKHTAVCFNVLGHATGTTIHGQYCRLNYNRHMIVCIIIVCLTIVIYDDIRRY